MIRRFGSGKLTGNTVFLEEDASPTWGVTNLADVMLVLAVGIMLALVFNWNIDVFQEVDVSNNVKMQEISDVDTITDDNLSEYTEGSGLEEKGSVFVDPETGKMYIVVSGDGE